MDAIQKNIMDAIAAVTSAEAAATSAGAASTSAQTVGRIARVEHQAQFMPWFRCNCQTARVGTHRHLPYTPVRVPSTPSEGAVASGGGGGGASTAPGAATSSEAAPRSPRSPSD